MCSKVKSKKRQICLKQVVKSRKLKILDWLIMTDSFFACEDPSTWLYQIKLKKAVSRALSKVQHYRITCFVTHFPGPNSTPAKFANVWQIQLSWITVVKFDTASGVHFSVTFLVLPSSSWLLKVTVIVIIIVVVIIFESLRYKRSLGTRNFQCLVLKPEISLWKFHC